ncbi:death-associated protein 1 [Lepeophtheirus salmonis]|uniref:Death-associated protein 1 n=1 Tax=Lepeophtheirus salmonis TaxID=72036 RepID=D3PG28_LEPSM|nr:death-associated protein 1-like [Lepeophtheirus salmonis]XP_040577240.1 death-associated protein 1-like [Lepeophtheirus salmonis]XP_040577241.1 death-associated protein 1-like [Lepeophtheirus salmonis]ADD24224.1 Death-associated protein 1 [Lepeophtheirus salmonis]
MSDEELKGGHAPALKVGGMRVTQHKPKGDSKSEAKTVAECEETTGKPSQNMMVSGMKTNEADAFPKEAIKAFHDKPTPTHDRGASSKPTVIQQPKK